MRHEKSMSRYETWNTETKRVAVMQGGPGSLQSNRTVDKGAVAGPQVSWGKHGMLLHKACALKKLISCARDESDAVLSLCISKVCCR